MQKRDALVNLPLIGGIILSIVAHAAALYGHGIYAPPKPKLDRGRTVVQLTLIPSVSSQAAPPEPVSEPIEQQPPEPIMEPAPEIITPAPRPAPEPVVEPPRNPEPAPEPEREPVVEPTPEREESIEQIGSIIEDKGVITEAQPAKNIMATYPRISQRRGEEGTVTLSIQILANGKPGHISITQSSGFKRLDQAAIKAAQSADYQPAEQFGRPVESTLVQPITFTLTGK